jgi:pilus assembly protein Flp/PilA
MKTLARFVNDQAGVTAIEYGLVASCISVAIITIVQGIGAKLVAVSSLALNALF